MANRRVLVPLLAALAIVGGKTAADNTLRVGVQGLPLTQGNPYRNTGLPNLYTTSAIFDGLTRIDEHGEVQPWLASSWENTGPRTWVFKLREDVEFSNGAPLTAAAVVAVVEFFQSKAAVREMVARGLNFLAGAREIDDYTVEVTTARPTPYLPRHLPVLFVVEPDEWRRLGPEGFSARPVGTGPFVVDVFKPGKIELSAFKRSWRRPQLNRLEIFAIPETSSRSHAVQSGVIDVALAIGPEEVAAIERSGGKSVTRPAASVFAINFVDKTGSPFKDRRVREALNLAVNRELLTDVLLGGVATPANQPAPPLSFGYNPSLSLIPYDPERAKQLLVQAGHADGFHFVMQATINSAPAAPAVLQAIAQDLARINVQMEIRPVTVAEILRNVVEGSWEGDAFALNYNHEPTVDAMRGLDLHSCLWRRPWYCDERIVPAIKSAAREFEPGRALALRHEIMAFYRREYASLFVYNFVYFAGMSPRVSGFKDVHGFIHFEDIKLSD